MKQKRKFTQTSTFWCFVVMTVSLLFMCAITPADLENQPERLAKEVLTSLCDQNHDRGTRALIKEHEDFRQGRPLVLSAYEIEPYFLVYADKPRLLIRVTVYSKRDPSLPRKVLAQVTKEVDEVKL